VLIEHELLDCVYIDNEVDYNDLLNKLGKGIEGRLAVDTESYPLIDEYGSKASALDPHTSKCRLISLYWEGAAYPYVIDLHNINPTSLINVIRDMEKVSHYATHDMRVMKALCGEWLPNWKCSNVAMTTLGVSNGWKASCFRGHGLKDLARDYFSIHLSKELGRSDWSIKELNKEQIVYSALDVAAPKGSECKSIILEGYELMRKASIDIGQVWSFDLDQDVTGILSRAEYGGLPMSSNMLSCIKDKASSQVIEKKMALCKSLELPIQESLVVGSNGEFSLELVIPEWASTLLNNNRGLVQHMNKVLRKSTGKGISDLKADTLEQTLKELEQVDEEDEDKLYLNTDIEYGVTVINELLAYKRFSKLETETCKYISALNPVTGCLHTSTKTIGTSTGRMSSSGTGSIRVNIQAVSALPLIIETDLDIYETSSLVAD
jgi:DNA polymerase I-like protein with 3'-5' exonuclease and polymerase domains